MAKPHPVAIEIMRALGELNRLRAGAAELAEKWRGENGDYPESKRDCADELETLMKQDGLDDGR